MKQHSIIRAAAALASLAALAGIQSASAQTLIDQWNFNETSGATAANSVGGGPSATLMGGATFNGSGGVTLNGTSGTYVSLGSGLLNSLVSVSFEGWFSYSMPPSNVHLFSFDNGGGTGSGGTYLRYNVNDPGNGHGDISYLESIQGFGGHVLSGNQVLPQNQELFVAAVYDPANSTESIYLNGVLENSYGGSLVALSTFASDVGSLGWSPWANSGDPYLNGTIDQFSIYNGALTSGQIASDFTAGPVPEPSTVAAGIVGGLTLLGLRRRAR